MTQEQFWKWFQENDEQLLTLEELTQEKQDALLEEFEQQLTEYCEGLTFDISPLSQSGREIVFSAEGDIALFEKLINLVESAPDFDWWEFIPFRQPKGNDICVHYDNDKFNTNEMYFLPLENEEEPDLLGVKIALPNYRANDEDLEIGVYVTLEAQVGEFDCATLISYMEICPVPEKIKEEGFIPLVDFPAFVEWFKRKREGNN